MQKNLNWHGLTDATTENCTVTYAEDGIIVRSEISGQVDTQTVTAEYVIKLDHNWKVMEFQVTAQTGSNPTQCYAMQRDPAGNWKGLSGLDYPEYHGCDYIDITLTPLTNSLPINSLALEIGDEKNINVLYIDIMEHELRIDMQRYTKIDKSKYRFENTNGFSAKLNVDEDGFVTYYPELFQIN